MRPILKTKMKKKKMMMRMTRRRRMTRKKKMRMTMLSQDNRRPYCHPLYPTSEQELEPRTSKKKTQYP
jgi:hypothetical protein